MSEFELRIYTLPTTPEQAKALYNALDDFLYDNHEDIYESIELGYRGDVQSQWNTDAEAFMESMVGK